MTLPEIKPKRTGVGIGLLAAICLLMCVAVSADVFYRGRLYQMDAPLARGVYGWMAQSPKLRWVCARLSDLGGTTFSVTVGGVVAAVLLIVGRARMLLLWLTALMGSALLNWVMKNHFGEPRPAVFSQFELSGGYTYPSGHTMAAIMTFGMIAYLLVLEAPQWRWLWGACAAVVIVAVSGSLLLLGVHYLTDIVGGLTVGFGWLFLVIALLGPVARRDMQSNSRVEVDTTS